MNEVENALAAAFSLPANWKQQLMKVLKSRRALDQGLRTIELFPAFIANYIFPFYVDTDVY